MLRKLLLATVVLICLLLGLVGLVIPIIPGLLFLAIALACTAMAVPPVKRRLAENPRWRRYFSRLDRGAHLPLTERMRLYGLSTVELINPRS